MKPTHTKLFGAFLALGAAAALSSCSTPQARLDAQTSATLNAMSAKLAAAKTLRVTATRESSPGFYVGFDVAEKAHVSAAVVRPNKIAAKAETSLGKRSVFFDGTNVTFVDHKPGTYAQVKGSGDIDGTVRSIEEVYGVMPPLAELITNKPSAFLLDGVTSGACKGKEKVGGAECHHLAFTQAHLSWDLWVGVADSLPKKMVITHPNGQGGAPLKTTLNIEKWELNAPVSAADVAVSIPNNSIRVDMIPLSR